MSIYIDLWSCGTIPRRINCEAQRRDGRRCRRVLTSKGLRRVWAKDAVLIIQLCGEHYAKLERSGVIIRHPDAARVLKDGPGAYRVLPAIERTP